MRLQHEKPYDFSYLILPTKRFGRNKQIFNNINTFLQRRFNRKRKRKIMIIGRNKCTLEEIINKQALITLDLIFDNS